MILYLDDDSTDALLVQLLRKDGHDVTIPADVGMAGKKDPAHLLFTIRAGKVLLTHNHDDFQLLHELVRGAGGHHLGILAVCRENDSRRDLKRKGVVRAIRNLVTAAVPIPDNLHVLNHYR